MNLVEIKGLAFISVFIFDCDLTTLKAYESQTPNPIVLKLGTVLLHIKVHVYIDFQLATPRSSRAMSDRTQEVPFCLSSRNVCIRDHRLRT